ncbi:MAG: phage portal protein, partial [Oscillospiraceae bacterium]
HIDLLGAATGIDKLIGSGVVCINDIRGLLGQPLIDEPWAWQHFITKNYSTVADLLNSLEGGETK